MNAVKAKQESKGEIQLAVPGLGERLRAARTACNLDLAKLAARIHLTSDVVDALECDDYSDMPARVFVRGYVRNYARTVNLPVESILAQFDRQWPEEDYHVQLDESPRLAADPHPRRRWPGVVTWLVVLVIAGLTLIWWQGYLDGYLDRWQQDHAATRLTTPAARPDTVDDRSDAPAGIAVVSPAPVPMPNGARSLALPPPSVKVQDEEPKTPLAAAVEAAAGTEDASGVTTSPESTAGASAETSPQAAPVPAAPPAATSPQVVVHFLEDSWVDIRDSRREYKFIGIKRRGTERRLGGVPPYTVVLGNARAVELRVNGKPFDLGPHTQNNVARFVLEP